MDALVGELMGRIGLAVNVAATLLLGLQNLLDQGTPP